MKMYYSKEQFANIKNRADHSNLIADLQRIEKEMKHEMRMHNTEKLRFERRLSRMGLNSSQSLPINDVLSANAPRGVSTVDLPYRTASRKSRREIKSAESTDFKSIHNLVFTDEEVDIEKILCLHLLSAHRAETLAPVSKTIRYLCKIHSPAEKLIERSKRGYLNHERLSKLLPLYTLESVVHSAMGEQSIPFVINDGRLAGRILMNQELRLIISTVVDALQASNPAKLKNLLQITRDPDLIKKTLNKPKCLNFVETIYNIPIITNCECFVLTPPFVIRCTCLCIETKTGKIENLLKHIRENVLQIPKRNPINNDEDLEHGLKTLHKPASFPQQTARTPMRSSRDNVFAESDKNERIRVDKTVRTTYRASYEEEKKPPRRESKNFIAKNIQDAPKTRKIEYDTDEDNATQLYNSNSRRRSSINKPKNSWSNDMKLPIINYNTALQPTQELVEHNAEEVDLEKVILAAPRPIKYDENSLSKKPSNDSDQHKQFIKLTTCPACMERWKTPLPSPKTPRIKRTSGSTSDNDKNVLKTNSINRINALIDRELYKLESYDRRYSSDSQGSRRSSINKQELITVPEYVKINPLELAKIQQEIKEKETRQKLEKFLREALDDKLELNK